LCTPTELQKLNAKAGLKDAKGVCIPSLCLDGNKPTKGKCKKFSEKDACGKINGAKWTGTKCECKMQDYEIQDNKCVKKSNNTASTQTTSPIKPSKMQRREQASQEIANEEAANQMINNAMNNLLHGNNEFK